MNAISISVFITAMVFIDNVIDVDSSLVNSKSLETAIWNELMQKLINGSLDQSGVSKPEHKIIGGWAATGGSLPFQVLISIYSLDWGPMQCGGSLITRRHVLTAAHCLIGAAGGLVVMGTTNRNGLFSPGATTMVVPGSNFIVHPDYDTITYKNDIAIIRLPRQATLTFTLRTIALPSDEQTITDYFAGMEGIISGFGKTTDDYDDLPNKLQVAYVNITTLQECQKYWLRASPTLNETQVCTIFKGSSIGTCQGDSGGPLAVELSGKMILVGITSFGHIICEKKVPSIYTNVASYIGWIQQVLKFK